MPEEVKEHSCQWGRAWIRDGKVVSEFGMAARGYARPEKTLPKPDLFVCYECGNVYEEVTSPAPSG